MRSTGIRSLQLFRGVEMRGVGELVEGAVVSVRTDIAQRYLGVEAGARFADERAFKPEVLLRLAADDPHVWDLWGILPA